jgi:hypothetical protein
MWIIDSGIKPGERVVSEGMAKVSSGAIVNPKPDTASDAAPANQGAK